MSQPILDGTAVLATILGNIPTGRTIRKLERTMLEILKEEPRNPHLSKHFPLHPQYGTSRSLDYAISVLRGTDAIVNMGVDFNLDRVGSSTHNFSRTCRGLFCKSSF